MKFVAIFYKTIIRFNLKLFLKFFQVFALNLVEVLKLNDLSFKKININHFYFLNAHSKFSCWKILDKIYLWAFIIFDFLIILEFFNHIFPNFEVQSIIVGYREVFKFMQEINSTHSTISDFFFLELDYSFESKIFIQTLQFDELSSKISTFLSREIFLEEARQSQIYQLINLDFMDWSVKSKDKPDLYLVKESNVIGKKYMIVVSYLCIFLSIFAVLVAFKYFKKRIEENEGHLHIFSEWGFGLCILLIVYQHRAYLNDNFTDLILYAQNTGFTGNFLMEFDSSYSKFPEPSEIPPVYKSKDILPWDVWYFIHIELYSLYILSLSPENRNGFCQLLFYEPQPTPFILDLMQNFNFAKLSEKSKNGIALESALNLKKSEDLNNDKWFYISAGGIVILLVTVIGWFVFFSKGGGGTSFPDDKISKINFEKKIDVVNVDNSGLLVDSVQAPVEAPSLNANVNTSAILQQAENIGQSAESNPEPAPISQRVEPSQANSVPEVVAQGVREAANRRICDRDDCLDEMRNLKKTIEEREARMKELESDLTKSSQDLVAKKAEINALKRTVIKLRIDIEKLNKKFDDTEIEHAGEVLKWVRRFRISQSFAGRFGNAFKERMASTEAVTDAQMVRFKSIYKDFGSLNPILEEAKRLLGETPPI